MIITRLNRQVDNPPQDEAGGTQGSPIAPSSSLLNASGHDAFADADAAAAQPQPQPQASLPQATPLEPPDMSEGLQAGGSKGLRSSKACPPACPLVSSIQTLLKYLLETKRRIVEELTTYLNSHIADRFVRLYGQSCLINNKEALKIFQLSLCRIPILTQPMIEEDYSRLRKQISPELLEKIGEIIDHLCELHAMIKYIKSNRKFPEKRLKHEPFPVRDFLHRCYVYTGRKLWVHPEILSHKYPSNVAHQNRLKIKELIEAGIGETVNDFIPIEDFYQSFNEMFSNTQVAPVVSVPVDVQRETPVQRTSPMPIHNDTPIQPTLKSTQLESVAETSTPLAPANSAAISLRGHAVPLKRSDKQSIIETPIKSPTGVKLAKPQNFKYLEKPGTRKKILIQALDRRNRLGTKGKIRIGSPSRKDGKKRISFQLPGKKIRISLLPQPSPTSSASELMHDSIVTGAKTDPTRYESPRLQLLNSSQALSQISSNASESFKLSTDPVDMTPKKQPTNASTPTATQSPVFSEDNDIPGVNEQDELDEPGYSPGWNKPGGTDTPSPSPSPKPSTNSSDVIEIHFDPKPTKRKSTTKATERVEQPERKTRPKRKPKVYYHSDTSSTSTNSSDSRIYHHRRHRSRHRDRSRNRSDRHRDRERNRRRRHPRSRYSDNSSLGDSVDYKSAETDLTRVNRLMGLDMSPRDLLKFGRSSGTTELNAKKIEEFSRQYDHHMQNKRRSKR